MKKREKILLLVILGVSTLTRGLTLFTPTLGSDETAVGLMSLMVMKGDFPVFYYGQNFMGSLEAFLGGSFFQFFGPSPFTLELLAVIFSILFIFLLYFLSKLFFGYKTALISIALLSIPPLSLLEWSHETRLHYHFVLIFGNFLLIISHKLIYQDVAPKTKRILFTLLGLLSGIGWWNNYLIITYLLPVGLFLFLRDKKVLFTKNFIFLLFMFLLGCSPLWAYNIIHHFPIIGIMALLEFSHIIPHLKAFCINAFPIVLGFLPPLSQDRFDLVAYLIIATIYLMALFYYAYRFRGGLKSIFYLRLGATGGEIFLFLFLVNFLLTIITVYGIRLTDNGQQYLLPLYTCLPVFLAVLLVDLEKKFIFSSFILFGLILLSNFTGIIRHDGWTVINPGKFQAYQDYEKTENRLIDFLINNGYTSLYYPWPANRFIFKSKEALIVSHPFKEGWLNYSDQVDASPRPGYLFQTEDKAFEENMKAIGGSFRKIPAPGGYVLYTEFKPLKQTFRMIPRNLWTGTSNVNPSQVKNAFDGDIFTGWKTPGHQQKGTYFFLDLGRGETVGKISYIPAVYDQAPAAYQVALSSDGKNWQTVSQNQQVGCPTFWAGPIPMTKLRHGRIETVFPPHPCRFLKISLLKDSNDLDWAINELFVFSPDNKNRNIKNTSPESREIDQLLTYLKTQRIDFVYTNNWLAPLIRVKSHGKIRSVISNYFTGKNGEEEPLVNRFAPVHLDRTVAVIVEEEDKGLEKILMESNHLYRKKEIGPFMVYFDFSNPKCPTPLLIKGWKVTSNANPEEAEKAIDQDLATRWSSKKPQEPGIYYQIDLNTVQLVKGCTLSLGKSLDDYPRSLRFLYSLDGSSWQEIKGTAKLELYWTGETLLKMTGEKTRYFFSPVHLKYLKLIQEGRDPVFYWSIHELELY
jgi:hypothetical protein